MGRMYHLPISCIYAYMGDSAAFLYCGRCAEKQQVTPFEFAYTPLHFMLEGSHVPSCILIPVGGVGIHRYLFSAENLL